MKGVPCKYHALTAMEEAGLLLPSYKAGIISDTTMIRWEIFKKVLKDREKYKSQEECVTMVCDEMKIGRTTVYDAIYDIRCR